MKTIELTDEELKELKAILRNKVALVACLWNAEERG